MRIGWKKDATRIIDQLLSIFFMAWLMSFPLCIRAFHVSNFPKNHRRARLLRVSNVGRGAFTSSAGSRAVASIAVAASTTTTEEKNSITALLKDNWQGDSVSSEYVTHVSVDSQEYLIMMKSRSSSNNNKLLVAVSSPVTVLDAVQSVLNQQQQQEQQPETTTMATPLFNNSQTPSPPLPLSSTRQPQQLSAQELIALGSVWFLPKGVSSRIDPGDKPKRLYSSQNETRVLQIGDYLRVHHSPRRFVQVREYDWSRRIDDDDNDNETSNSNGIKKKPGVIVAENEEKGWLVIDKPPGVPVHATVDNCRENVQDCLYRVRKKQKQMTSAASAANVYVSTPHRLDQNTSGLFVVATSKLFAGYYAQLLRYKTTLQLQDHQQQNDDDDDDDNNGSNVGASTTEKTTILGSVHKVYRCLVCIIEPAPDDNSDWSVKSAVKELMSYATNNKTMRHFLEPSIRAPKRFLSEPPAAAGDGDENDKNPWLECLLKIRSVGQVCALVGNRVGEDLGRQLWSEQEKMQMNETNTPIPLQSTRIPENCRAVVELEIELLTGRTHQIRGQLAASGFPLVGDAQYGGAIPIIDAAATAPKSSSTTRKSLIVQPERLALQCCELEFVDPDIYKPDDKDGDTLIMKRSKRWNKFRLSSAWWTTLVQQYNEQIKELSASEATTSMIDVVEKTSTAAASLAQQADSNDIPAKPHLLPDRIQLSPGKNKYVLIRATHPNAKDDEVHWFVKSAAPEECGGPYHGNVAHDLCEWIKAAGFSPQVTGGGRINYDPTSKRCIVYGFSYGFGKGDHSFAANLIRRIAGIPATHDDRDGLY